MAGKRTKDITSSQTTFSPELVLLVDRIDTGSGDWLQARKLELGLLGNTYMQGSSNGVNWHDSILATDTYFRYSTDNGVTWITLNADNVREGSTNKYYTEAKVSANIDVVANTSARHTHSNKTVLDSIINTGPGTNFLTDDGTYKTAAEAIPALIDHSLINNLDYASSGHTGFEPARLSNQNYVTDAHLVILNNTSNINTGDQTSIVGITGTLSEFNAALTDADFATGGGTATNSNTGDQNAIDVPIVDSGGLYTATEVESALAEVKTIADNNASILTTTTSGESITLPSDTTVAGRILGAVEGIDYPTGWALAAGSNPVDIDITHNTGKRIKEVTIFSINGTEERILLGNAAWSGFLTPDSNSLRIESLATINTTIKIYITFA